MRERLNFLVIQKWSIWFSGRGGGLEPPLPLPLLRACRDMVRRYPGGLVYPFVGEDAASDDKIVQSTEVSKSLSILVHFSEGMLSHHFLVASDFIH